jgi:hypothetical protein
VTVLILVGFQVPEILLFEILTNEEAVDPIQ